MKSKIAALFLLFAAISINSSDFMKISAEGISINVPLGWLAEYKKTPVIFMVYSPEETQNTVRENYNLVIENLPRAYTLEEYSSLSLKNIKALFTNIDVVEQKNNYHIYKADYNGIKLQQIQYFFIKNKIAYVLTFSSVQDTFEQYKNLFFEIAKSFEISK